MYQKLWIYREFIYSCVKREFEARYQGSVMGVAWSVFQPLAMILVYTVIFSSVMKSKLAGMEEIPYAYSIYLCAGLLPWNFFQEMLLNSTNVFLANGNLMKKVFFPRICLPVITACSSLLNFLIAFFLFAVFLLVIGRFPWHAFPAFFLLLGVQMLFCGVIGVGLGVLNVFFRDVAQIMNIILQFWFWLTPIVYPLQVIPEVFHGLLNLNPMYLLAKGYQGIFVYNTWPDFLPVFEVLLLSVVIGVVSLHIYRAHVGEMVDEL